MFRGATTRSATTRISFTENNQYYVEFQSAWDGIGEFKKSYTPIKFKIPYESVTLNEYKEMDTSRSTAEVITLFNQGLLPLETLQDVDSHYADFTEPIVTAGNVMQSADYDYLDLRLANTNVRYVHYTELDG